MRTRPTFEPACVQGPRRLSRPAGRVLSYSNHLSYLIRLILTQKDVGGHFFFLFRSMCPAALCSAAVRSFDHCAVTSGDKSEGRRRVFWDITSATKSCRIDLALKSGNTVEFFFLPSVLSFFLSFSLSLFPSFDSERGHALTGR